MLAISPHGDHKPKVSIIIPTFNRAHFVGRAIESALSQDYDNLEVVVSDNASTDSTWDVVSRYSSYRRLRSFRNEANIGMVGNWRLALSRYIEGDWFLILSDDDYLIDDQYISKAMNLACQNENVCLIYASGYIGHLDVSGLEKRAPLDLPFDRISRGIDVFLARGKAQPQDFTLCNVLFKRKPVELIKPFNNPNNLSCDTELFLNLCLAGDVGVIKDRVSVYTLHQNNLLKSATTKISYVIGNLDAWLKPCQRAVGRLSTAELREFIKKSGLERMVQGALTRALLDAPDDYPKLCFRLREIQGPLGDILVKGWRTRLIINLCKYTPNVARAARYIVRWIRIGWRAG